MQMGFNVQKSTLNSAVSRETLDISCVPRQYAAGIGHSGIVVVPAALWAPAQVS